MGKCCGCRSGGDNNVAEVSQISENQSSSATLLFREKGRVGIQSYDRFRGMYIVENASSGEIEVLEPDGFFSGDTLWVAFVAKENEEHYHIRINAILPDVTTLGVPGPSIPWRRTLWLD